MPSDRHWLLTWHTYGTRLPGDPRGFVSPVRDNSGNRTVHNTPGSAIDAGISKLHEWSRKQLKGPPIVFQRRHAEALALQLQETARYRTWELLAFAIVTNHVHMMLGVPGDPEPETLLRDLKSYGSRALNQSFGRPLSETWWTENGSTRVRKSRRSILVGIRYILKQQGALVTWTAEIPELNLNEGFKTNEGEQKGERPA